MTNTLPSKNGSAPRPKRAGKESAVGLAQAQAQRHRPRTGHCHPAGRPGVPRPLPPARPAQPRPSVRRQAGVLGRGRGDPAVQARLGCAGRPDAAEEERLRLLRPDPRRRAEDDRRHRRASSPRRSFARQPTTPMTSATYPADLVGKATELGITAINVPEDFDGIADHRAAVTNVLVAEALAYGDMGLALPILAPAGVASALTHWGSADQQATYLKEFAGENVPQACVAICRAASPVRSDRAEDDGSAHPQRLPARRRQVIGARRRERRIVHRGSATQREAGTVHRRIVIARASPSPPIRAWVSARAALGQVELDHVTVPLSARLGEDGAGEADYSEAIALSRLGWAALAVGTVACGARLRRALRQGARTHSVSRSPTGRRWRSCAPTSRSSSTVCG